jgi:hypothetical protein
MANEPVRAPALSRELIERALARAAELQARGGDADDGLTEAQLIEVAAEVGLSRENVRQAIAEERARVDLAPESGAAHSMLGSAVIQAARSVPMDMARAFATMDAYLQRHEALQPKRRQQDQLSWEPRQDFVASIRRALRIGGRGFHLAAATEVRAVVADLDGKRAHVRLVADLSGARSQRAAGAIIAAAVGLLVGVPAFWLATNAGLMIAAALSLVPALALPLGAVTLARQNFRRQVTRAQVALEQVLDRLEYDEPRRG